MESNKKKINIYRLHAFGSATEHSMHINSTKHVWDRVYGGIRHFVRKILIRNDNTKYREIARVCTHLVDNKVYMSASFLFSTVQNPYMSESLLVFGKADLQNYSDKENFAFVKALCTDLPALVPQSRVKKATSARGSNINTMDALQMILSDTDPYRVQALYALMLLMVKIDEHNAYNRIDTPTIVHIFAPILHGAATIKHMQKKHRERYDKLVALWVKILNYMPKGKTK